MALTCRVTLGSRLWRGSFCSSSAIFQSLARGWTMTGVDSRSWKWTTTASRASVSSALRKLRNQSSKNLRIEGVEQPRYTAEVDLALHHRVLKSRVLHRYPNSARIEEQCFELEFAAVSHREP